MSQAKIYTVKTTRKTYTCTKCRKEIVKGGPALSFAVGFRGTEQRRHDTPACRPSRAERESSMVGQVYDAQDSFDLTGCDTLDSITEQVEAVAEAAREVASEYEANEMFEINEDLQERADTLNSAADELDSWSDALDDEPEETDPTSWGDDESFVQAHEAWLSEAIALAETAVNDMELP